MTRKDYQARSTRALSTAQEKLIAKNTGNRRVPNSGAGAFFKGDNKGKLFLIEAKTVMKRQKSFTIKEEWIDKLIEEAFGSRRPFWSLVFNFGGYGNPENFYIINQDTFNLLQELLEARENEHDID